MVAGARVSVQVGVVAANLTSVLIAPNYFH